MKRNWLPLVAACALMVASIPSANADFGVTELDDMHEATCDGTDGLPLSQSRCEVWNDADETYHCSLNIVEDADDNAGDTVDNASQEVWPTVQGVKCSLAKGIDEDLEWWNEDVRTWRNDWFCYTWDGSNICHDYDNTPLYQWALDRAFCALPTNPCNPLLLPPMPPPFVPPCPPYPTTC